MRGVASFEERYGAMARSGFQVAFDAGRGQEPLDLGGRTGSCIQVALEGGRETGGRMHFEPGTAIRGHVRTTPRSDVRCSRLMVRLQWHTEGRGTRDEGKVEEADLFHGIIPGCGTSTYPFEFILPPTPWSYAGYYVSIVWEVAVEVDVPFAPNLRYSEPFVMAPVRATGTGVDLWLTSMGSGSAWSRTVQAVERIAPETAALLRARMDTQPVRLLHNVRQEEAEAARVSLERTGAEVSVRPAPGY